MAGATGKRRVLLLFSVLAGLFLMHGLTGGGLGGESCHSMAPVTVVTASAQSMPAQIMPAQIKPAQTMPAQDVVSAQTMPARGVVSARDMLVRGMSAPDMASSHIATHGPPPRGLPVQTVSTPATASPPMAGDTCVPLRPEGLSALFLALFLIVITMWRPRLPHGAIMIRPHWPHGPPRTGVQVLHALSVSRT